MTFFAVLNVAVATAPSVRAESPPIVTLSGAITEINRGPSHEDDPTMLGAHDIAFDGGFAVTRTELGELPQQSVEIAIPGGEGTATFTGPRLADVLDMAGSTGSKALITALDGYGVEIDRSFIDTHTPLLAIAAEGASMAIGDLGPSMIVFPPTEDAELQETFNSYQVWAVFHIGVN
ncbi:hypothetical protein [Roseovarius aestuariivivens]|uniref:hypothetical protein n=1 Tax=Roseovarius aestuariivivens TaxID=1888910 RepID=UPI001081D3FA|nr:hypothetical protein [Roseovarius aestuariivivens]